MISKNFLRDQIPNPDHKEKMIPYMYQIFARDSTTENAIMVCFNFTLCCRVPLAERLKSSSVDVSFIYGSNDWVWLYIDRDASKEFDYSVLGGASHNLHYSNPEGLCKLIIEKLN